ncbi:MAG: ATP-binding protein [Pseudomonadota bacterium]
MNLRRQLLLVSLLLLALPWAGCQYVREMESALQAGQVQALQATSRAVATVVADQPELLYPNAARLGDVYSPSQLYASLASRPPVVDGYADGWGEVAHARFGAADYQARVHNATLYLLFRVRDDTVVYQDPRELTRATGDRLILSGANGSYVITTAAPGAVQGRIARGSRPMGFEPRIRGYWQDSLEGYSIELRLPLAMLGGHLGFALIDVGDDNVRPPARSSNLAEANGETLPWLIVPSDELSRQLTGFTAAGMRLDVIDRQGWVAASAQAQETMPAADTGTPWLLRALYRAVLRNGEQAALPEAASVGRSATPEVATTLAQGAARASWYRPASSQQRKLLLVTEPIVKDGMQIGAILARQSSEPYLSLTDQAFSRLLYWSLLAMLLSAVGLLGYASLLSWRIRRLSRASIDIIHPDGSLANDFPVSQVADEIGELSRQYADLMSRLREYTDYLRSLSRKLSHELRTPIAVIQSSLDNLSSSAVGTTDNGDTDTYIARARDGLSRLSAILTAMSEASRLEESVHANTPQRCDISDLLNALVAAYQDLYPRHRLQVHGTDSTIEIDAVPDLIAQMLDKLVDNAVSFAPEGGSVDIGLEAAANAVELTVINDGPLLPEAMQQQLFDSMVSLRERSERMHLGLGLHIVKLIVDFHKGSVRAVNREDGSGVVFAVRLPLQLKA